MEIIYPQYQRDFRSVYLVSRCIVINICLPTLTSAVMKYIIEIRKYCIYRAYCVRYTCPNIELKKKPTENLNWDKTLSKR